MNFDPSIYRAANLLVEHYGERAPMGAAIKADSLRKEGKLEASAQWMRVAKLAEELLSDDIPAGTVIH